MTHKYAKLFYFHMYPLWIYNLFPYRDNDMKYVVVLFSLLNAKIWKQLLFKIKVEKYFLHITVWKRRDHQSSQFVPCSRSLHDHLPLDSLQTPPQQGGLQVSVHQVL